MNVEQKWTALELLIKPELPPQDMRLYVPSGNRSVDELADELRNPAHNADKVLLV